MIKSIAGFKKTIVQKKNRSIKEKGMFNSGKPYQSNKSVVFSIAACLVLALGCGKTVEEPVSVETEQQELTFKFKGYSDTEETVDGSEDYNSIWTTALTYCNWKGGSEDGNTSVRFAVPPTTYPFPYDYLGYRGYLCMGDFFMELADGVSPPIMHTEPNDATRSSQTMPANTKQIIFDTLWPNSIGLKMSSATLKRVEFSQLETAHQREQVKHMAYVAYQKALTEAMKFFVDNGDNSAQLRRMGLYYMTDEWFSEIDGENATGPALMKQMIMSLSQILQQIKEIKIELAEERIAEGIFRNDTWGSSDSHGRKSALRHIFGTLEKIANTSDWQDNWRPVEFSLLPSGMTTPPSLSVQIKNATAVLKNYQVDIQSSYEQGGLDYAVLLQTANAECDNCYSDIDALAYDHGTTKLALSEAVKYLYAHMLTFPRLPSDKDGVEFYDVGAEMISSPSYHYMRKFEQDYWGTFWDATNGVTEETIPITTRTGIVAAAEYWESVISTAKNSFNPIDGNEDHADVNSIDLPTEAASVEGEKVGDTYPSPSLAHDYLEYNRIEFNSLLGNKRIHYSFDNSIVTGVEIKFEVLNPQKTDGGLNAEHLRLIPLASSEGVAQMKNLVCAHLDQSDQVSHCDNSQIIYPQLSADPCTHFDDQECVLFSTGPMSSPPSTYWAVEIGTAPNLTECEWHTTGVILMDSVVGDDKPGYLLIEGEAIAAADRILDFDSENINDSFCIHLNGLQGPCVDQNWVPAIDNELIDNSGLQYEQSYRHYLNIARNAAEKARGLREQLMSDIIDQAQGEALEEAQLQSAIDNYMSGIREICGDNMIREFKDWAGEIDQSSPLAYKEELRNRLIGQGGLDGKYSCNMAVDSNWAAPFIGPIHCAEKRNCNRNNEYVTTLGRLGMFGDVLPEEYWFPEQGDDTTDQEEYSVEIGNSPALGTDIKNVLKGGWIPDVGPDSLPLYETLSCDDFEMTAAEILNPSNSLFSVPGASDTLANLTIHLKKVLCWAEEYKQLVQWYIKNEPAHFIPSLFDEPSEDDLIDGDLDGASSYGHGRYYTTLLEIEKAIEEIRSAGESYVTEFDNLVSTIKIVENTIQQHGLDYELKDLDLAWQLTGLIFQQELFNANYEQSAETCIQGVKDSFGKDGAKSRDNFTTAIKLINRRAGSSSEHQFNRVNHINKLNDKLEFIGNCSQIAGSLGAPFSAYANQICIYIADNFRNKKNKWFDKWGWEVNVNTTIAHYKHDLVGTQYQDIMPLDSSCQIDVSDCEDLGPVDFDDDDPSDGPETKPDGWDEDDGYLVECSDDWHEQYNQIQKCLHFQGTGNKVAIRCKKQKKHKKADGKWSFLSKSNYSDLIDDFEDHYKYCFIKLFDIDDIAKAVWNHIKTHEFGNCAKQTGCDIRIRRNQSGLAVKATVESCDGIGMETYDEQIAELELHNKKIRDILDQLKFLSIQTDIENFSQKLTNSYTNIKQSRSLIKNRLRTLAQRIASLSALEHEQIDLFDRFINNKLISGASNIANLAEWNERFDFRRDEYERQLKRARMAAWVARRAIEFRFGIDLSEEYVQSLHGDIPAQWANDIYDTSTVKCGDGTVDSGEGTEITDCLAKEDRIEDYVQKLEDYVLSYGNSLDSSWWLHEDDDTAVISLRDHLTFNDSAPMKYVNNIAYHSEDFEPEPQAWLDGAETIATLESKYGIYPQRWVADDGLLVMSDNPEIPELGLPGDVISAHFTNEWEIFPDWEENYTADLLVADAAVPIAITQNVDYETVFGEYMSGQDQRFTGHGDFSVYLREAPMNRGQCDSAAGEEFFPGLGRCGIPCDVTTVTEDANGLRKWEDCAEGQVCMLAGLKQDELSGKLLSAYLCDWCSADRSCFDQDGQTVALELNWPQFTRWDSKGTRNSGQSSYYSDPASDVNGNCSFTYRKNVHVRGGWDRASVSSDDENLFGIETTLPGVGNCAGSDLPTGSISIKNTATKNLVLSSERLDDRKGWDYSAPDKWAWRDGKTIAPDGTYSAQVMVGNDFDVSVTASFEEYVQPDHTPLPSFTGSVWLKSIDSPSVTLELAMYQDTKQHPQAIVEIDVGDEWKRYQISALFSPIDVDNVIRAPGISIEAVDGDIEVKLAIWGAQIETGGNATTYIPTGKNLIPNSRDLMLAEGTATNSTQIVTISEVLSPRGTRDVLEMTDNSTTYTPFKMFRVADEFDSVDKFTFSVWLKSGDGQQHYSKLALQHFSEDRRKLFPSVPEKIFLVEGTWRRYELTADTQLLNYYSPDYLVATIYPLYAQTSEGANAATGTVLVWGPQLEEVDRNSDLNYAHNASGYQETWRKNMLHDSNDLSWWSHTTNNILSNDQGPFGTGNVYELRDDDPTSGSGGIQNHSQWVMNDWKIGETIHFSIYVKNTDGLTDRILWRLSERTASEVLNGGTLADCPLTNEWSLCELTHTITGKNGVAPDRLFLISWPVYYGTVGTVYAWGPQLEYGTARTSYQPTGGQTHLLPDGRMESTLVEYWTAGNGAALTKVPSTFYWSERALRVTHGGALNYPYASQAVLQSGQEYKVQGWARSDGQSPPMCKNSDGTVIWTGTTSADWQYFNVRFTATGANLLLGSDHTVAGGYAEFDNVLVTAVDDLPLIIDSYGKSWGLNVGVTGAQLTPVGEDDCPLGGGDLCLHGPLPYNRNTYLLEHFDPGFELEKRVSADAYPTSDQISAPRLTKAERMRRFKNAFTFVSSEEEGGTGYHSMTFNLNLASIENGMAGHFGVISPNNFNYRLRTFAVNIAGTEVLNCELAESPETCLNNPWLTYDLKQMGNVRIRNHHKEMSPREFVIPSGRISGGQAWAAEQVIGYPISGLHQGALSQLQKISLMGRPLQGTYEIRIYAPVELEWQNVEDIQLIMGYHYWTRSE